MIGLILRQHIFILSEDFDQKKFSRHRRAERWQGAVGAGQVLNPASGRGV
jgi:hypothetical protein